MNANINCPLDCTHLGIQQYQHFQANIAWSNSTTRRVFVYHLIIDIVSEKKLNARQCIKPWFHVKIKSF